MKTSFVARCVAIMALLAASDRAQAQWSRVFEQFYFPDQSNWAFRHSYAAADRLFNAFDYGHAILYEKLYTRPAADPSILEVDEYNFLTREVLVHPPRVPLEEGAIEVAYAKLAPEAKAMFEWAHVLHRQIYDVWADERIDPAEKDARIARLLTYYRSRRDLAYSTKPKSMDLMEGQYYSLAFRQRYPKFNGLIWAYHWLQIGLYEPLMAGKNPDEKQTGVVAAVAQFRHMIQNPPTWMPRMMPMTPAIAPMFTARYPEAGAIFDNLHAMHDVISDILASEKVPRHRKRAEILRAAQRFRDDTSYVMTVDEWKEMATMMGVQNMGGPVTGVLAAFPTPTIERGESAQSAMQHMQHGAMQRDSMAGMPRHAMPSQPARPDTAHAVHVTTDSMPMARDTGAHAGHVLPDSRSMPMSTPAALKSKAAARKPAPPPKKTTSAAKRAPGAAKSAAPATKKTAPATKKAASPTKKPASAAKDTVDHSKMDHSKMAMPPKKP